MKRYLAALALAAIWATGALSTPAQGEGGQEEREIGRHERRMMEVSDKERMAKIKRLNRIRKEAFAWGRERRGTRSSVITLKEPLERIEGRYAVEIELFMSFVDNGGRHHTAWRNLSKTVNEWFEPIRKQGINVGLYIQHPGSGPYLLRPAHVETRRSYRKPI